VCLRWCFSNDSNDFLLQPMEWLQVGSVLLIGSSDSDGVDEVWVDEGIVELGIVYVGSTLT
jgi:hypothetical protein